MERDLIHLCDLTHTSQGYAAELTPYPVACIKAWLLEYSPHRESWRVDLFKDPQRCFGVYSWDGEPILSAEIEEVCVESSTLPYEDYLECRSFALTMGLFYQDRILHELHSFLRHHEIPPSRILSVLHARRHALGPGIAELFRSFDMATDDELWESADDLEAFTKSDASIIERHVRGELGNNILFRHRAIAFDDLIDEIHEAAFSVALEMLRERDPALASASAEYLGELQDYSRFRKRRLFDLGTEFRAEFHHDFESLLAHGFEGEPRRLDEPVEIRFFPTKAQTELLEDQLLTQGSDLNGKAKLISRIPVAKLQRAVEFARSGDTKGEYESRQFASPAALSPGEFS